MSSEEVVEFVGVGRSPVSNAWANFATFTPLLSSSFSVEESEEVELDD